MNQEEFNFKKLIVFILITISLLMISYIYKSTTEGHTDSYKVINVTDGDTIEVEKDKKIYTIRLLGIDTPELHKPDTPIECYAKEAQIFLEKLLINKNVTLEKDVEDQDIYQRKLRYVFLNGQNINKLLIENGFSYLFNSPNNTLYHKEFVSSIKFAMNSRIGIWKYCVNKDIRVMQYFNKYKINLYTIDVEPKVAGETTENCNIKGNVNSKNEKIYHLPGSISYDKIVINPTEGDQIFCTESEATNNGFRKAKQ